MTLQRAPPLTRIFAPDAFRAVDTDDTRARRGPRAEDRGREPGCSGADDDDVCRIVSPHSAEAQRIRMRSAGHTRCNLAQRDARPPDAATYEFDAKQEDRMKRFTSLAAAVFTAAFLAAASSASAQDSNVDQRTYLTFSGPVQMPGMTLPAGKYVFQARSDRAAQRDAGVRW